jgi:hypothetical protein
MQSKLDDILADAVSTTGNEVTAWLSEIKRGSGETALPTGLINSNLGASGSETLFATLRKWLEVEGAGSIVDIGPPQCTNLKGILKYIIAQATNTGAVEDIDEELPAYREVCTSPRNNETVLTSLGHETFEL